MEAGIADPKQEAPISGATLQRAISSLLRSLSVPGGQAAAPAPVALKYRAFLSYSHADTGWAKWLHTQIERTQIDKDLIGRVTANGVVPNTLRPVFRDRHDFSAGDSLKAQTLLALDQSAALIVLCTPAAARSINVDEEIRLFRHHHPERPVIPVIIDGEPGDTRRDCFPRALCFALDPGGTVTDQPIDVLAADLRAEGDGRELAVAKIVARLLALPPDDVYRRAERHRRRALQIRNAVIAALSLLSVMAAGSAVYAWHLLNTNERFLNAVLQRTTDIITTTVKQGESYKVPRSATLETLKDAEDLFTDMATLGRSTRELASRKAWMLLQFAGNYSLLGDTKNRAARANEALAVLRELERTSTGDPSLRLLLADALAQVGHTLTAEGKSDEAKKHYIETTTILERLSAAEPANDQIAAKLALALRYVAGTISSQGQTREAIALQQRAIAIASQLVDRSPENPDYITILGGAHFDLGDMLRLAGRVDDARGHVKTCQEIGAKLTRLSPDNLGFRSYLGYCDDRAARLFVPQGQYDAAMEILNKLLEIRREILARDPDNARWQRDLYWAHVGLADVLRFARRPAESVQAYATALALLDKMSVSDARNRILLRERAVFLRRMSQSLAQQGQIEAARDVIRQSNAILTNIVTSDASNLVWQCDLAMNYDIIGQYEQRLGRSDDALASFQNALDQHTALLRSNPDNAAALLNMAATRENIGDIHLIKTQTDQALQTFRISRDIRTKLRDADPADVRIVNQIARIDRKIADVAKVGSIPAATLATAQLFECGAPLMWVVWR